MLANCEICVSVADAVFQFFTRIQAELYGNEPARADLAARGGFCRAHAQQFESIAAGREAATALGPVLLRQALELRRIAASTPTPMQAMELVGSLLPSGGRCPACAIAQHAEMAATDALAGVVRHDGAMVVHARSAICLPHLRLLMPVLPSPATTTLLRRQAALMERLAEDASRFALKQDAARRSTVSKQEREAAWHASRVLLEAPQAQYDTASPARARQMPQVRSAAPTTNS